MSTSNSGVGTRNIFFAILLGLVLGLHWLSLAWLHQQFLPGVTLRLMPQPLFTRVIKPTASVTAAPRRRAAAPKVKKVFAQAQLQTSVGAEPAPAQGVPAAVQEPQPPAPTPDPSVVDNVVQESKPAAEGPVTAQESFGDWPADTRLSYRLKGYYRGDMYGSGQVQWQQSQGRYQVQVDLRMAFVVTGRMVSQGDVSDAGLLPHTYEERLMGEVRRLTMDGVAVKFHDGSAERQPQALQDTASQFVELSRRFSSGRQILTVGAQVPLWLARPNAINLWTYDVIALETLQLSELGEVPAYHLRPRPVANPRGVITAEMWFAPSLQYLPVRIRISLGGDNYVDLTVEQIEQGAPVSKP